MKGLAVALLFVLAVTHFGYDAIALGYPDQAAAAKAWFYMLRGIEGVVLFAVVAYLTKSLPVLLVCLLGMFEEGMTAACRAGKPIGESPGYAAFSGLCGQEWHTVGLVGLGLVALGIAYDIGRDRAKERT